MSEGAHTHANLMAQIHEMGYQEDATAAARVVHADAVAKSTAMKSPTSKNLAGIGAFATGQDGTLREEWDPYLPRPPSMRQLTEEVDETAEQVAVFNANTHEGSTMVKVLSEKGLRVVAAVRVFTSRNTKALIKLKGVTVKVADWSDEKSLLKVAEGCSRAFLVTKYWEKFDSRIEEQMAVNILRACSDVSPPIKHLVLSTFEDTKELKMRNRKSQLVPTRDGRIFPRFDGMVNIDRMAKKWGVQITHMMTSFMDEDDQKKSIILIRGDTGRIIVQPYFQEVSKTTMM
jgi:NmrA-like family